MDGHLIFITCQIVAGTSINFTKFLFQNNPQLMSHDYAKSPLMEDVHNNDDTATGETIDEVIEVDPVETDEAISKFDPRTKQLFEPHKFAPKVTRISPKCSDQSRHCDTYILLIFFYSNSKIYTLTHIAYIRLM